MFTCKRCKKKVATVDSRNQQCVDCDRARKREKPKDAEEPKIDEKKEDSVEKQKKDNEEGEAKTEAKWP